MGDKLQVHATGIESFARCGVQWSRRYLDGDRRPPSARMLIGTAVDRGHRANMQHKLESGELLPVERVKDEARDTLVRDWADGVQLTEEDHDDGTASRDRALDMSVGLAGFSHSALAPQLKPTHVARKWVLDIEGMGIQLAGEIDLMEFDYIRDLKTSGKSPVRTLADESLQLSVYALAVRQIDGVMPENVALDYLVQTPKRGDQKLVTLEGRRNESSLGPVLARLDTMNKAIQSGIFIPCEVGHWACSARWCSYHSDCRFACHPVSVAVPGAK